MRIGWRAAVAMWLLAGVLVPHARGEIEFTAPRSEEPIRVRAEAARHWREGSREVWLLEGNCLVSQGPLEARSQQAVLWLELGRYGERSGKLTAYLESNVEIASGQGEARDRFSGTDWLGTFESTAPLEIHVPPPGPEPVVKPAVYRNAAARTQPQGRAVQQVQFTEPVVVEAVPPGMRRVRINARSSVPPTIQYFPNERNNEWIVLLKGGVNLIIEGGDGGPIDVSADRVVIWTAGLEALAQGGDTLQRADVPLQIYMEGNVVFLENARRIDAQRMYYDVNAEIGTIVDAELLTPVPDYEGLLRLRADLVQQTGPNTFLARNAFLTSSRLGAPTYRFAAGDVYFEDFPRPVLDPATGQPLVDPTTGAALVEHDRLATSFNNVLLIGELPVFYWPVLATELEEPVYYVDRVRVANDQVFGFQVRTDWDLYHLLGITEPPEGTEWGLDVDYLSKRGLGVGTDFTYARLAQFDVPRPYYGLLDVWGINDHGVDVLGSDRMGLEPEEDFRYRVLWQHRQQLPDNFQLTAELGLTSDRNFLEQFFEDEWDQLKDQTTSVELKQTWDNMSWSAFGQARLNDFFKETEWLPRLDHFWLGQPLLGDQFTWYEHSYAGYARLRPAEPPENPVELAKFGHFPWEVAADGEIFVTRQEIDYPFELGPVKLVPYALGELAHFGEDLTGDDLDRAYGQLGIRGSIPFWTVNPEAESVLFNVHGLAHKVVFEGDFSVSDASRDLADLPLFNELDDNSIEQFRRRLAFNTFGTTPANIPLRFDPRFYALRSGMGSWVTAPVTEIADDLTALRLGARQRWQTKRGLPGQRRIIDFIVLDTEIAVFPDDERDNFGESLGLAQYDFRWHVGDRTTVVSDGIFDFFADGQAIVTLGAFLNRPPRGSLFLGINSMDGPIESQVLTTSYTYRMSPKWASAYGASYDLTGDSGVGQQLTVTRIGESFLVTFGFNYDAGKDNVGAMLMVEPRFLPTARVGRLARMSVPVAGAMGLE